MLGCGHHEALSARASFTWELGVTKPSPIPGGQCERLSQRVTVEALAGEHPAVRSPAFCGTPQGGPQSHLATPRWLRIVPGAPTTGGSLLPPAGSQVGPSRPSALPLGVGSD